MVDDRKAAHSLATVTSTTLLEGLKDSGNQTIWLQFVDRYRPLIQRYGERLGLTAEDAEDATQASLMAFCEAYREAKYERARGRLGDWLFGIVHNQVRNQQRKRGRSREVAVTETQVAGIEARGSEELERIWEEEWQDAVARECLASLGVFDPVPEISIKGYLFQSPLDPLPPPCCYNTLGPMQQWFPLDIADNQLGQIQAKHYLLPEKARWLSPVQAGGKDELLSRSELLERLQSLLAASPRARLVAALDTAGGELCRFFVTPNDWPATAENDHLKEKP